MSNSGFIFTLAGDAHAAFPLLSAPLMSDTAPAGAASRNLTLLWHEILIFWVQFSASH